MITPQHIQQLIEQGLPQSRAYVEGDDGTHFSAIVVSDTFAEQTTVARHRMVYATLGERMGREIHALSLTTLTPEQWSARQGG